MGLSGSVEGKKKENHEYCSESQVNCEKLDEKNSLNHPKKPAHKMDINDISGLTTDVASEDTLESEIDALSKIITDTKDDDIHKLDENDEVFKLDSDDISFTDDLQETSAKDNKCELIPDDNLGLSDILDESRELENFTPASNAGSDIQEVLKETFETVEDSGSKCDQLNIQTNEKGSDGIVLLEKPSCIDNDTPLNAADNEKTPSSLLKDQSLSPLRNETNEYSTAVPNDMCQQPIDKNVSNNDDNEAQPMMNTNATDCLSDFMNKDDSQNVFEENLDTTAESDLDGVITKSIENKCIDQTDFTQAINLPSGNSDYSDVIFKAKDTLTDVSTMETGEEAKESKSENFNIPATEVINSAKESDVHKISIETSTVQETITVSDGKICKSTEVEILNQTEITEISNSDTKDIVQEIITGSIHTEIKVATEDSPVIDEPTVIDEIPAIDELEKEENIEKNDSIDCQNTKELKETIGTQNLNEDNNETNVVSECNTIVCEDNIPKSMETENSEFNVPGLESTENNSVTEINCNLEDKVDNIKVCKEDEIEQSGNKNVDDQESMEITDIEQGSSSTEESSNIDIKTSDILEKVESTVLQNDADEKEQPVSTENLCDDIKLSLEQEDSLNVPNSSKDFKSATEEGNCSLIAEDIAAINGSGSDSIVNTISTDLTDIKEIPEENKITTVTQKTVESSSSEQDSKSQGLLTNVLNEKDLNNATEAKETITNDISNFDNSEVLNSSDQIIQPLDEKSQDPLSMVGAATDQVENEKLTREGKTEDITFEESSQSPGPMQSDKFISDLYDSCMPDDTTQFSNTEIENDKESTSLEISKPLKIEDEPLLETKALEVENIKESTDQEPFKPEMASKNQGPSEVEALEMENVEESSNQEICKSALEIEKSELLQAGASEEENDEKSTDLENLKTALIEDQEILEPHAVEIENLKEGVEPKDSKPALEVERQEDLEKQAPDVENIEVSTDTEKSKSEMEIEDQQIMETDELEMENSEDSTVLENIEAALEIEDQQLVRTEELDNATESISEEIQSEKVFDEPSTEISELETAVKFLQESEQTATDSSAVESVDEGNSSIFVAVEESECDHASEMSSDLPETTLDPIAISEAEIISEAAKLENERKEKLELEKLKSARQETSESEDADETKLRSAADKFSGISEHSEKSNEIPGTSAEDTLQSPLSINTRLKSEFLPKTGVIDERYKEPPKIEIPETGKLAELPKTALLIQKQRLDSPDRQTTSGEPKISDTPTKKDSSDKQQPECENVGSPRIILKIAKSAIAECAEPRSPKSPKVRSSDSPNPEDSPSSQKLGKIKLKLSKGGHPSIIPSGDSHQEETWHTDCTSSSLSPISMKIKLSKTAECTDEPQKLEEGKEKPETPIGMKIKLSKSGDASIVQQDNKEIVQETITAKKQDSPSLGMKIKLSKSGDASIIQQDKLEQMEDDSPRRTESPIGMKIKLSKSGDASVISNEAIEPAKEIIDETIKRTDSPIGVKIKLAKNKGGSASIISTDNVEELAESPTAKAGLGMKIKLSKSGDASVIHTTQDDVHEATEQHIGMKIKLSKTGDPSIIPSGFSREYEDIAHKSKHSKHKDHGVGSQRSKDDSHLEMKIKLSKTGHPSIISPSDSLLSPRKASTIPKSQGDHADIISFKKSHSDVTIEPIKSQSVDNAMVDLHGKRKETSIAPIEMKRAKIDGTTTQMLPDITIQPIASKKEQSQKLVLDSNTGSISRQQMSVINQEISITQVRSLAPGDPTKGEHLKNALNVPTELSTPSSSDCEIIEAQPELIIVNENSNSSQDVMIIDEVPPVKTPKKRGRPRRNALPAASTFQSLEASRDPLSLDQPALRMQMPSQIPMQPTMLPQVPPQHIIPPAGDGTERPRRTCRNQKSYAPPKRGRGRGRGKRKNEALDSPAKKSRVEQEFVGIEHAVKPVIALEKLPIDNSSVKNSPELFRALNQPSLNQIAQQPRDIKIFQTSASAKALTECEVIEIPDQSTAVHGVEEGGMEVIKIPSHSQLPNIHLSGDVHMAQALSQSDDKLIIKVTGDDVGKQSEVIAEGADNSKESTQNWLAPSIKKLSGDAASRSETISSLTVIDEETRMSAESNSRSQTPARTMLAPGTVDTLVNEESQNSVLSTATTESEKVKQPKNRRMEIALDPDEGPFTVEKIAEYEWPPSDKSNEAKPLGSRGETFMIQEQISQYLGVKSFKRKYPDLKRRMVDMEERNFLRENALVSESMCDMGLTAVSSSEVLDIMCSDFPEQYEEYRKHMREKAAREHSKKQKELSAAANAERNRIDLAEMAMQSAISWNSGFNKARQESRRCSLDLQTFTVHTPRRPVKYDPSRRCSNYPVAILSGQYTDHYRVFKPAELRYYPLNTVIYGPTKPNERKFDSQSEGSQSDSDSDSSSDDSSSTSSEGTQDTEGSQSTMDEVDMELALDPSIKCKMCSNHLNKNNRPETLIVCGTCNGNVHPSCIDLTLDMVPHIRAYAWQCTDCKTCAQCHDPADEDKMLFCDMCDRGYHIYCVGLRRVPQGRWHCQECAVCANCGSKEPGGANSDRNSVAQWQHEFKKGDKNTRVYVSTFCVPCSKLWRKGRYCPHCSRCHNATRLEQEPNLVHCGACDKYLHLECVETKGMTIDRRNYLCEFCSPNRQQLVKPLTAKTFKT